MFSTALSCSDISSTIWGIFDFTIAPNFLFYAYIPIGIISLILGTIVLAKEKFSLRARLLFSLSLIFLLLLANEILQWIAAPVPLVLFGWELVPLFRILVALCTLYFVYVFIYKKDMPFIQKLPLVFSLLLVAFLLPTTLNIQFFDYTNCEGVPGALWEAVHVIAAFCLLWIAVITTTQTRNSERPANDRLQNIIVGTGATIFLLFFFATTIWGDITLFYDVALVGPAGMLLFIVMLSYVVVRFKAFNIQLAAPIALVFGLWALVFSLLFITNIETVQIIVGATLVLLIGFGLALIRSVKREIKQREQIEELAVTLDKANERLKILDKMKSEFVSIASHQLRSPLTSIRGYASMLAEGSYGKLPEKAVEAVTNIADSSKFMALSIEDYLNVSRIEAGNMKYELSDFNLREATEKIVDEMRPTALKKGLVMVFRSDCNGSCLVHADIGKTRQVIMNLLDNSMKYTPKGTITVVAHDDIKKKKMYVTIQDTGVGMSKETQEEVFDKFVRAKNANNVNVTGTGLGLFVAKKMITEMGGKVWAESEGEGKGSTFHIELSLLAGKSAR